MKKVKENGNGHSDAEALSKTVNITPNKAKEQEDLVRMLMQKQKMDADKAIPLVNFLFRSPDEYLMEVARIQPDQMIDLVTMYVQAEAMKPNHKPLREVLLYALLRFSIGIKGEGREDAEIHARIAQEERNQVLGSDVYGTR